MSTSTHAAAPGLARVLGPITAIALVAGSVIGSGVFKKPAIIAQHLAGSSALVALVWIIAGLLIICGALAYAEVSVLFPRTGGNYVFLREGYGRLAGFLWVWVDFWIIRSGSIAALATIFTESLHDILKSPLLQQAIGIAEGSELGFWSQRLITVSVILGLGMVNIRGVRWGGGLQVVVTIVKIASLIGIAVLPLALLGRETPGGGIPTTANLDPLWPKSWALSLITSLGAAFLAVQWSYHGWQNVAPIAGEVRNPQRNIPIALLGGVLIVMAVYLGANFAYYLTMPAKEMAQVENTSVAAACAFRLLGPIGLIAISAAIMLSVFGALNGNIMVGPRQLFAMGEDGLAPRWLGQTHSRYHTPAASIGLLVVWASLLVIVVALLPQPEKGKSHFDRLTDFAMFGAVIFETLAVLAIYRFRRRLPHVERPYRCPGYPWVPVLYTVLPAFILASMFASEDRLEALVGVGFIALGAAVFYACGLQRGEETAQS